MAMFTKGNWPISRPSHGRSNIAQTLIVLLLSLSVLHLITANPLPEGEDTDVSPALSIVFVCNDSDLGNKCRHAPYNFRCTSESYITYDVPYDLCSDRSRCSCEAICTNPRTC